MVQELERWFQALKSDPELSRNSGSIYLWAGEEAGESVPTRHTRYFVEGQKICFSHGAGDKIVASQAVAWRAGELPGVVSRLQSLGFAVPDYDEENWYSL